MKEINSFLQYYLNIKINYLLFNYLILNNILNLNLKLFQLLKLHLKFMPVCITVKNNETVFVLLFYVYEKSHIHPRFFLYFADVLRLLHPEDWLKKSKSQKQGLL